ncbi:hypothetical protein [Yinghuangia seranimata]|uniref:MmyB family transcriptional regulator n=1 Tax=Yinghuangia seranimata TaxID=408067 RepID=UPI00248B0AD6|nr:hypothetical protein [Yinghuangia seranimata]MDI2124638.1 hypothetical protein [Yinghuangia seranimata]
MGATTRALLDTLDRTPALVVGPTFDILVWNPVAARLMGDLEARPAHERNLLWQVFCCPVASAARNRPLQDTVGADLVAGLRAYHADRPDDAVLAALVAGMSEQSPVFRRHWHLGRAAPPGQTEPGRETTLLHAAS